MDSSRVLVLIDIDFRSWTRQWASGWVASWKQDLNKLNSKTNSASVCLAFLVRPGLGLCRGARRKAKVLREVGSCLGLLRSGAARPASEVGDWLRKTSN